MQRRAALVAAALAAAAGAVAAVLRRRRTGAELEDEAPSDARAEELRRKLEEARGLEDERDEFEGAETRVDQAQPAADDLEARRRAIHEAGRGVAEEMRGA